MRYLMILIIFLFIAGCILFTGSRLPMYFLLKSVDLPDDLDVYLVRSESKYPGIRPGTEKKIIWAKAPQSRTLFSIVYLHGYSSTRHDTFPLCEQLAAHFGANIFYTRLSGHGLNGEALADAQPGDLLQDALEALAIGRRIGEKVIVIGNSSGGALALWLAEQPGNDDVLSYVVLSPALGFRHPLSGLLTGLWARQVVRLVVGPEYGHVSSDPGIEYFWTTHYPSRGLITPAILAKLVWQFVPEKIHRPVLVLYSPQDQLVSSQATMNFFQRIIAYKKIVAIQEPDPPENHVLAGDLRAPRGTNVVSGIIVNFISEVLKSVTKGEK